MMEMKTHPQINQKRMMKRATMGPASKHDAEAGTSNQQHGKQHTTKEGEMIMNEKDRSTHKEYKEQRVQGEQEQKDKMQIDENNPAEMNTSQESEESACFEELLSPGGTIGTLDFSNNQTSEIFTECN
jgi:hypothetical protein